LSEIQQRVLAANSSVHPAVSASARASTMFSTHPALAPPQWATNAHD
jgi:hypothetical protein